MRRSSVLVFSVVALVFLGVVLWWLFRPAPNRPPIAAFAADIQQGPAPLNVVFDASESSDPDGEVGGYAWDFGDGQTGEGLRAKHTYETSGVYTATLTVTDNSGETHTARQQIRAGLPAPDQITAEAEDARITLRWSPVSGADFYRVYCSEGISETSPSGEKIAEVSEAIYEHTGLQNGLAFSYVVTALNELGESSASDVVSATVAPKLSTLGTSSFQDSIAFLYSGDNPLQTGVEKNAVDPKRATVLRGRVFDRVGDPLAGVKVCLLNDGKFGQTRTRSDGMFDFVVNGGGPLTVCYEKQGYLPVQRKIRPDWRDYTWLPDVVMIPADEQVTTIDLNADAEMQVARGSSVRDQEGNRQATLLIPKGTEAEMVLPDGTIKPLENLSIRMTEYTVGDRGPSAMPAPLPPSSAYTYCVELSADEATEAGANLLRFNRPLVYYVENLLDFPVGGAVPTGYYDRDKGAWVPSDDGRIIQILSVDDGLPVQNSLRNDSRATRFRNS